MRQLYSNNVSAAKFIVIGLLLLGLGILSFLLFALPSIQQSINSNVSVFDRVVKSGVLRCGVQGNLRYFSLEEGEVYSGFDADYCRVIATALFGEASDERVEFVKVNNRERFSFIHEGVVDVVVRNSTSTIGRELEHNVTFGPTIFYDSPGILVLEKSKIYTEADLNGKTICVSPNTTTEINLKKWSDQSGIAVQVKTGVGGGTLFNNNNAIGLLVSNANGCDGFASDRSQLIARIGDSKISGELSLLDVDIGGKEPLAPLYRAGDVKWARLVDYAVNATIFAAELGVSKKDLASVGGDGAAARSVEAAALLTRDICLIAKKVKIDPRFVFNIVKYVGNYDDIYTANGNIPAKNADGSPIPRGLNQIYVNTPGLLYSPPFTYPKVSTSCELDV